MSEQDLFARLSDVSYQDKSKRQQYLREHLSDRYQYIPSLSGKRVAVVRDTDTDEYIVSMRGTQFDDLQDVGTDLAVAFGNIRGTGRFKSDLEVVENLVEQHGRNNVILTGHSLGGSVARNIARELGTEAYVYNPGSGVGHVRDVLEYSPRLRKRSAGINTFLTGGFGDLFTKKEEGKKHQRIKESNIHTVLTGSDPISNISKISTVAALNADDFEQLHIVGTKEGVSNPHSLQNFFERGNGDRVPEKIPGKIPGKGTPRVAKETPDMIEPPKPEKKVIE